MDQKVKSNSTWSRTQGHLRVTEPPDLPSLPNHLKPSIASTKISPSEAFELTDSNPVPSPALSQSPLVLPNGNLAVGAIANLVDEIGAIVVHEKDAPMNVSVDMSIS
ncbi:hypothetical protein SSX86_016366 [Deinandra increscens subsp. villosa]|uniref:Uncharacterized protein n=1 Tax=Deinandra increscens subsp. villosa TaxID=3103831 RepID=A0AAP0D229_9ASTR